MHVLPEATIKLGDDKAAAPTAKVVWADQTKANTVRTEPVKTQAALLKQPRAEAAERAPRLAVANKQPSVPATAPRRHHSLALAAAAVIVTAIGVGAYWLRIHEEPVVALEQQAALVAKGVPSAEDRVPRRARPAAAPTSAQSRKPAPAPPTAATPARAKPKPAVSSTSARPASAARAPAAKPVRTTGPSTREPVRDLTSVPAANAGVSSSVAPDAAPDTPDVVATAPAPATPAPPVGPFFETKDVTESPRVATRVEPRLPDELRARPIDEIVIVRALVSQSGHPSRISLLRRSKTGPQLDDVVVAAVNQWTFSPARKRGEPVSCWLNFGVPVGRRE
jgi:TonB family protein